MEARIPVWRLLTKSRREVMVCWTSRSTGKWSDLKYKLKVKSIGFADKLDTGFKERRGVKMTPEILTQAAGSMGLLFIEMWKAGRGKGLGEKRSLL